MKVICSYCKNDIEEKTPLNDIRISHGICKDCFDNFDTQLDRQEMNQYLEEFSLPVMVVNSDSRILGCNTQARNQFGIPQDHAFGILPGEMMGCNNARQNGCGKSEHCLTCTLRKIISTVSSDSSPILHVDAVLSRDDKNLELVVSAEKVSSFVKVTIEQINQTA